jgi:hypothetical protein
MIAGVFNPMTEAAAPPHATQEELFAFLESIFLEHKSLSATAFFSHLSDESEQKDSNRVAPARYLNKAYAISR